ncbi:DUF7670 domain-containing protein [Robertkochia sediminum]|uniref:DUF7670 domain-containing protein n=1 Tax=Robertkochia sediminum TaxID=2785326 RepID=UPI001932227A|nr:hypothetical protein [Robertkochia sediminum]MBL7472562.1 hypothetical protein [Robertkochia sediminum]
MKGKIKFIHWIPRILCILAILFVSIFALDAFQPGKSPGEQLLDFTMHLIPSFILTLFLIIAWKWELVGGILFTAIGLVFTPLVFVHNYQMNKSIWLSLQIIALITLPFVAVGLLFIKSYKIKKKQSLL